MPPVCPPATPRFNPYYATLLILLLAGNIVFDYKVFERLRGIEERSIKTTAEINSVLEAMSQRDMKTWEGLTKTVDLVERKCIR